MSDFWKKTLEAAAWTFLEVFVVTFAASFAALGDLDWGALGAVAASALLSALGAVLSLIKSVIVRNVGAKDSPLISGDTC